MCWAGFRPAFWQPNHQAYSLSSWGSFDKKAQQFPNSLRTELRTEATQNPAKAPKKKTHLQTLIVSLDSWSSTLVVHTNTLWSCTSLWQTHSRHCATHVPPRVLVLMRVTPKHWPNAHVDVLTTNATKLSRQIKKVGTSWTGYFSFQASAELFTDDVYIFAWFYFVYRIKLTAFCV